jgi:methylenetetrahydrofolate dehydrogenase (NADP+)/methenyltetrahydrofolate cyclohydrolase
MIIDGRRLAETVYEKIRARVSVLSSLPRLTIFVCEPNFATEKYLALKERKALDVGIVTNVITLDAGITTEDFIARIVAEVPNSEGIIVQLPLPHELDTKKIIASIPTSHDADALNPETHSVLSPVVATFKEILRGAEVSLYGKFVTIIGSGRLGGLPSAQWFQENGASVSIVTSGTEDISFYTKNADIIVCGAGVPNLLTPNIIKDGVIILDAGTSEDGGELKGDADPRCADKASIFTPVPGGVGPVTIAMLLSNVVDCAEAQK